MQVSRPDSHDIVVQPPVTQVSRPDSHDIISSDVRNYIDAADRARRIDTVVPTAYTDAHERERASRKARCRGRPKRPVREVSSTGRSSGSRSVGLLLATGLFVAMRMTRNRPLAH